VSLPIFQDSGDPITFTIDWGDGDTDSSLSHTYATNASFTAVVTITAGSVVSFGNSNWSGGEVLTAVSASNPDAWGLPGVTSFANAFSGAVLLTSVPINIPSSVTELNSMFNGSSIFNQDISGWDVSGVLLMNSMFQSASTFNQDISGWYVNSVTNMSYMFSNAFAFNNGSTTNDGLHPLTWTAGTGTSNVTNMSAMFYSDYPSAFNQDISSWNVSKVENMGNMFKGSTIFNNGDTGNNGANPLTWTAGTGTSNVTDMNYMFFGAAAFNQDISSWNVSKVIYMNGMFQNSVFNNGDPGNNGANPLTWTTGTGTSNVENMEIMFGNAQQFNQDISSWNVSSMIQMNLMFLNSGQFNNGAVGNVGGKPLTWTAGTGTSKVTNMSRMFEGCITFNQYISSWNVSLVANMSEMFNTASIFNNGSITNDGLNPLTWTAGTGTSNVTNMYAMFYYATAFNQDISSWNVSKVENMGYIFGFALNFNNGSPTNDGAHPLTWTAGTGTSNVTSMNNMFQGAVKFNQNVSSWNVSKVTNMNRLFSGVGGGALFNNGSITDDSANPITWSAGTGTSNVTDMGLMFESQGNFNQDISSWNVSKVTNMTQMFQGANFNPNISGWDVSNVTNMSFMLPMSQFNRDISLWNVSKVTDMSFMFLNATTFDQDISLWNVSKVTDMSRMFDGATTFDQDIRVWAVLASITLTDMFLGATAMAATYGSDPGYGTTPLYTFFTPISLTLTFGNTPGSVTLPISGSGVAVSVNWGDSTTNTSLSHTYAGAGPYYAVIEITAGTVASFGSPAWTGVNKLTDVSTNSVSTWGLGASLTSLASAFDGATILTSVPSNIPSSVTNTSSMFKDAYSFDQDISGWDVSSVTDMSSMFNAAVSFNQDISLWSVGNVTNMTSMFSGALLFNKNIRNWVVSAVTTLTDMFQSATAFQNAFYPTTPGYNPSTGGNATPLYTFFDPASLTLTFSNTPGSVTLPISGTSVAVSVDWGDSTIDTSLSHTYAGAGPYNAVVIITSGTVTTFGSDTWTGVAKLSAVSTNNIARWGLGASVTSFAYCFKGAVLLTSVPSNIPSNVTNLQSMFQGATLFNQGISGWSVTNITNMTSMFQGATAFNRQIRTWNVSSGTTLTNMFSGATAFIAAFYPTTPGYNASTGGNATPLYTFFNLGPYPCFLEGSKILCFKNNKEVYRPVESLRKGDLVKTIHHGYLPIHMIGTSPMYNPSNNDRFASRLYRCPKENYPGLFEDLYITGCHSILVPWLTYEQGQKTIASLGKLYVTDKHCRLMAWVDEKTEPYRMEGIYNIYHIALQNEDYYMNYGIYANGLLVESCSKRYLTELSNMRLLGEEDSSVTEDVSAEENVFHKMPRLVDIC
jgi:surface protein